MVQWPLVYTQGYRVITATNSGMFWTTHFQHLRVLAEAFILCFLNSHFQWM